MPKKFATPPAELEKGEPILSDQQFLQLKNSLNERLAQVYQIALLEGKKWPKMAFSQVHLVDFTIVSL